MPLQRRGHVTSPSGTILSTTGNTTIGSGDYQRIIVNGGHYLYLNHGSSVRAATMEVYGVVQVNFTNANGIGNGASAGHAGTNYGGGGGGGGAGHQGTGTAGGAGIGSYATGGGAAGGNFDALSGLALDDGITNECGGSLGGNGGNGAGVALDYSDGAHGALSGAASLGARNTVTTYRYTSVNCSSVTILGAVAIFCQGACNLGTIYGDGRGALGGAKGLSGVNGGRGAYGTSAYATSDTGGHGGRDMQSGYAPGGGGGGGMVQGAAGASAPQDGSYDGRGGLAYSDIYISTFTEGAGGGGGGAANGPAGGDGGAGGASLQVTAPSISHGQILCRGNAGGSGGTGGQGGGGGGGGGMVWLRSPSINGSGAIYVDGGAGGPASYPGGAGSYGRLRMDYIGLAWSGVSPAAANGYNNFMSTVAAGGGSGGWGGGSAKLSGTNLYVASGAYILSDGQYAAGGGANAGAGGGGGGGGSGGAIWLAFERIWGGGTVRAANGGPGGGAAGTYGYNGGSGGWGAYGRCRVDYFNPANVSWTTNLNSSYRRRRIAGPL